MRGRGNYKPIASFRESHGGINHIPRGNFRGGYGDSNYIPRANFRGRRGSAHYTGRPNFRDSRSDSGGESFRGRRGYGGRGDNDDDERYDTPPDLSISERKKLLQKTAIENFSSYKLTNGGSDQIVFIINGERIKTVWKKKLEETPWYQNDVRIFISSALVTADSQKAGELVAELSNPEGGLNRLKEIIDFPMSCDAGLDETVLSFQYVILPLLGLLTRTAITRCPLEDYVDDIFMVVYKNIDLFLYTNVMKMLETLVQRNSIEDYNVDVDTLLSHERYSFIPSSLGVFFLIIVRFLAELLRRIKEASTNETTHKIFQNLQELKAKYRRSIEQQLSFFISTDPLINNSDTREYFFTVLDDEMEDIIEMLVTHDVPEGISKISIIPTIKEILCDRPPYLPSLSDEHHSLPNGAARLLDRQFRLLREDMLNPIRGGISNFLALLSRNYYFSLNNNNRLSDELKNVLIKGKFTYDRGINHENGDLHVYADIRFAKVDCDRRNGLFCTLKFNPKINNSINGKRGSGYWKKSKRLLPGNLVALLLPNPNLEQAQPSIIDDNFTNLYLIYFGVIMSRDEITNEHMRININFNDPSIYPIALNKILKFRNSTNENNSNNSFKEKCYMVEQTSIYFEAYYHVLKTLKNTKPFSLRFKQYLAPVPSYHLLSNSTDIKIKPPRYTIAQGFQFDLSVLCENKKQNLKLNVANAHTYNEVAEKVNKYSKLDKSQAEALISALTREIALIEGPPGTGKTVVGVEIMKVLLAKKNRIDVGPILTICFTNHALDQFLMHLLDENITENIVRLGTRTKSERIKKHTLGKVYPNNDNTSLIIKSLEKIEKEIREIKTSPKSYVTWKDISDYLYENYRSFFNRFSNVIRNDLPNWVLGTNNTEETDDEDDDFQDNSTEEIDNKYYGSDDENEEYPNKYQGVQRKQKPIFERWLKANDIRKIEERKNYWSNQEIDPDDDEFINDYDEYLFVNDYNEPKTNRSLNELLNNYSIWKMSIEERKKLHDYWRAKLEEEKLLNLGEEHEKLRQKMNDIYNEAYRQKLLNSDVIGMTTSGAAKFQNLIKYVCPKIIICEEAGEVLEAHILCALTSSTQHLILIGDHNQLRPHVATYSLSMESHIGKNYQLDKSLFERLVYGDKAVKIERIQLLTQRRMRKDISDLIRNLYPNLEDGENTKYEDISGVQDNLYFIDHNYPEENCGNDLEMQSHVNIHEVKMVVEMVKYFVKYGYTNPKDIAVLTPYLGQMSKIKEALSKSSFIVDIDERDAQEIAEMEEENDTSNSSNQLININIKLSTVDNFQGEEANIVIISLVRNYSDSEYSSIGFLKSKNRSNVLLSRARKGMYLIGNSKLMASESKDMWASVVEILCKHKRVGPGMPIVCKFHPDSKMIITEPEQFDEFCSPNGGCRSICDMPLPCGHQCTDECHFDNLEHKGIKCRKPCKKRHAKCEHKCTKLCYKDCGKCNAPVGKITLPCGHILLNAECWQNQNKEKVKCNTTIDMVLPDCGHPLNVECWRVQNKEIFTCHFSVDITLPDCGHPLRNVECCKVKNGVEFICYFPVDITLPCGHILQNARCWKSKSKETLKCYSLIDIILPDCDHPLQNVECWRVRNNEKFICNFPIDIILPCGHMLHDTKCWKNQNKETIECNASIDIELPGCGHIIQNVECWRNNEKENIKCKSSIDVTLSCGHILQDVECWRNKNKQLPKCNVLTNITLSCGHMLQNVECHNNENKEEIECNVLTDVTLLCGHILQNVECWKNKYKKIIKCNTTIDITLECGHLLQSVECWRVQSKEKFTCNFPVDKKFTDCDHSFKVKCYKKDVIKNKPKCNHLIDEFKLPCGHESKYVECWKIKENRPIKCIASINFELPCEHVQVIKCWESQIENIPKCNVLGEITFPCGHMIKNVECWKKESIVCTEAVTKRMPHCEHINDIQCSESNSDIQCRKNCGIQLKCGHKCLNECFRCQKGPIPWNSRHGNRIVERTNHEKCKAKCNKSLCFGHMCEQLCHEGECQPCKNKCAISCEHTKKTCNKDCLEPCAVCAEKCSWECKHQGRCELSCGIPCDRLPCNERCNKLAKCGHVCAGICGEICPSYCADANCAPKKIKDQVSDIINNITFNKIDWNKERMVVLPCKHIYTMKSMDMLMGMEDYYEGSIDGRWTSVKLLPNSTSIKTCPECHTPIRDIRRYGRIIKKYILDIQTGKFLSKYEGELSKIAKRVNTSLYKVEKGRNKLKDGLCNISELKTKVEFKDKERKLTEIIPYHYFENIALYHGFDENSQQVWLSHIGKLLHYYNDLIPIIRTATTIPPHKRAFEASLNANVGDLTFMSQLDHAIYLIYLDGILKIISIQKTLYDEILFIINVLSSVSEDIANIKELWKNFAESLQQTIRKHLNLISIASESSNYGKYSLLVKIEIVEFDMIVLGYPHKNNFISKAEIIKQCKGIKERIANIYKSYSDSNAEEELSNRLDKLWKNYEEIENYAENLKY
ncbi:P-loop containing nucleoside triphosphate hydrolase protein [Rhizophagus clarus]|uniref:P-loop containing nucleoside triphosphate hydrolase protein n=1 Tax=Rhizophagus clarus TaxID=94130 RepID=A0A8H3LE06_9GLOM|nr:P-loop containing nucleoside triphosphate hydrolase protein [Rhizophagus clarus]